MNIHKINIKDPTSGRNLILELVEKDEGSGIYQAPICVDEIGYNEAIGMVHSVRKQIFNAGLDCESFSLEVGGVLRWRAPEGEMKEHINRRGSLVVLTFHPFTPERSG